MPRYIDADVLRETIQYYHSHTGGQSTNAEHCSYGVALKEIDRTPTADVAEVKHGEWKQARHTEANLYICSECDAPEYKKHRYCPNCGAKMDGKGDYE